MAPPAPRVTLITTFRNAGRHLAACVESIRAQTDPRWTLLLYDDGSSDDALQVAQSLANDPRIQLIACPPLGRRVALAACHAMVTTPFVAWVDADDMLEPCALEATLGVMDARPECGLVYTAHRRIDEGGNDVRRKARPEFSRVALLTDFVSFHFRLIRTAVFDQSGGISDAFEIGIDYDLCLRIAACSTVLHLAEPLYVYREHSGQMSSTGRAQQRSASLFAVNASVRRAGLHDRLTIEMSARGRFVRRVEPGHKSWRSRVTPLASMVARRPASGVAQSRVANIWPFFRGRPLDLALEDGLFQAGCAHRETPPSIAGLVRAAYRGQIGEVLVLCSVVDLVRSARPGEAAARRTLLRAALARVRAQGSRVVWLAWSDARRVEAEHTLRGIAPQCDVFVVDDARLNACRSGAVRPRILIHPVPCLSEHIALHRRTRARAALGLADGVPVVAQLGAARDPDTVRTRIEIFAASAPSEARLLVDGRRYRELARQSAAIVGVEMDRSRSDLSLVIAAADAVCVESCAGSPVVRAIVEAQGRPLVPTEDIVGERWRALVSRLEAQCTEWHRASTARAPQPRALIKALMTA